VVVPNADAALFDFVWFATSNSVATALPANDVPDVWASSRRICSGDNAGPRPADRLRLLSSSVSSWTSFTAASTGATSAGTSLTGVITSSNTLTTSGTGAGGAGVDTVWSAFAAVSPEPDVLWVVSCSATVGTADAVVGSDDAGSDPDETVPDVGVGSAGMAGALMTSVEASGVGAGPPAGRVSVGGVSAGDGCAS
jgi:hypothetical protein